MRLPNNLEGALFVNYQPVQTGTGHDLSLRTITLPGHARHKIPEKPAKPMLSEYQPPLPKK